MHARNVEIVLGASLSNPVKCLICWTPGGQKAGGTGQGIRIALAYDVPVYNLALPDGLAFAKKMLGTAEPGEDEQCRQLYFNFS